MPSWAPLPEPFPTPLVPGSPYAVELATTLEVLRLQVCVYSSPGGPHDVRCDCKFGLGNLSNPRFQSGSEKSGCPELRSVINYLLGESN